MNLDGEPMLVNGTGQHPAFRGTTTVPTATDRPPRRAASPVLTHQRTLAALLGVQVVHVQIAI